MKSTTSHHGKIRLNGHGIGSMVGDALAPLMEGPIPESEYELLEEVRHHEGSSSWWVNMRSWMKMSGKKRSDPRILLGILGCPLSPVPVLLLSSDQPSIPIKHSSMVCPNIHKNLSYHTSWHCTLTKFCRNWIHIHWFRCSWSHMYIGFSNQFFSQ